MDNRVYYGQYSLNHWLDLILKQNIILPDYQRLFVWDEKKVRTLIKAFRQKQFVPPITIGSFNINGTSQNLILDGQQRLTTILLAYLGLFPDKELFKIVTERLADENDDDLDDGEPDDILEWNFKKLTSKGNSKDAILAKIQPNNYKVTDFAIDDRFLKETFLGFSYLVPQTNDQQVQQRYYSSVFRNINIGGQRLLPQESRASLYFLKDGLKDFFDPQFIKRITIKNYSTESSIDFLRFLAILSHYAKDGNSDNVAGGFKSRMEEYYEDYIYSVAGDDEPSNKFKPFSEVFPDGNFRPRFDRLDQTISDLEIPTQFTSIIEMDTYLFGLIYAIIFEDKTVDVARRPDLFADIQAKIAEFKDVEAHKKAPSALKYLRARITSSIEIYNSYLNG